MRLRVMYAIVALAFAALAIGGVADHTAAQAAGDHSPASECAPHTDYWKLDVPSHVESNVASDAVSYSLSDSTFTYTVRSDLTVARIVVKGGADSTQHSDTGALALPQDVSHVTFCFSVNQETTTTTTTTTTAPPETTTTTKPPRNRCPAGWGEILPDQPVTVTVTLPEAGTWALTGHGSNENASSLEGELEWVGYGVFPAPTVAPLQYDLGDVTVEGPTTIEIQVVPTGRVSVCVSLTAELVPATTTTTTQPPQTTTTTTTTQPPETTTTTPPPERTPTVPPSNPPTDTTVTPSTQVLPAQQTTTTQAPDSGTQTLPVTGASTALFAGIGIIALALGAALVGLSTRRSW